MIDREGFRPAASYGALLVACLSCSAAFAAPAPAGATAVLDVLLPLAPTHHTISDNVSVYTSALREDDGTLGDDAVRAYQIGWNQRLPQWRGHIDTALFYLDVDTLYSAPTLVSAADTRAASWGADVDVGFYLTETVSWTLGAGYRECEHDDPADFLIPASGPRARDECQHASDWTFHTTVTGEWPIGGTGWVATGTVAVSGTTEPRPSSDPQLRREAPMLDPDYLLDLTAGVRSSNWTILAYVENATGTWYTTDPFSAAGVTGALEFIAPLAPPQRRYGLRLRYDL